MCGIIMFTKPTKMSSQIIDTIEYGLNVLRHRGEDSYGMIGRNQADKKLVVYKTLHMDDFITKLRKDFVDLVFEFIIIHNRKSSIGGITLELAHPVGEDNIYVVHNGTKIKLVGSYGKSDTYGIFMLYKSGQLKASDLDNAGVVFIVDGNKEKIYIHKDNSRPLYFCENEGILSSEPILSGEWELIGSSSLAEFSVDRLNKTGHKFNIENIEVGRCNYCKHNGKGVLLSVEGKERICSNCFSTLTLG